MKRFCIFATIVASVFLSNTIYPEKPATRSLAGVSQTLLKEIEDVEDKLEDTKEKIQEVKKELEDVKRIATGTMPVPKPMPEEGVLEVTKKHIQSIDPAKDEAIGLHATPTGTSLPKFVDKLTKTQKAYKEANKRLQETIKDEKLLEKLRSAEPAPMPPVAPITIPPMAPIPAPEEEIVLEEAETPIPVVEPTPVPEPTVPEEPTVSEEETLMDILGGGEEKPANKKKKLSNRKKRRLKKKYLL